MVRKPDIQYITQFYSYGSEARAVEFAPARKKRKAALPKVRPVQKLRLHVDVAAVCGILVAVTMLILMAVGVNQYMAACAEYQRVTDQVIVLQNTNVELQQKYIDSYDPVDYEIKARALGMIPRTEAEVVCFTPIEPVIEEEPTLWEDICWFFSGLFA